MFSPGDERTMGQHKLRSFLLCRTAALLVLPLVSLGISLPAFSQDETGLSIRVDAREVVIPAFVVNKVVGLNDNRALDRILYEWDKEVPGLTAQNFRVFEDGVELPVKNVSVQGVPVRTVHDNFFVHQDYLCTQSGYWSTPDTKPDSLVVPSEKNPNMYLVSYVPQASTEGSCHKVKVKLQHTPGDVYSREEYCNKPHSASDPLNGSPLGNRMEDFAASSETGSLQLSAQVAWFFGDADNVRAYVTVEFPPDELKRQSKPHSVDANIAVLGLVDDNQGGHAWRFSDGACAVSAKFWTYYHGPMEGHSPRLKAAFEHAEIPERYQTEFDLPSGEYRFRLALSDGDKFGRAEVPLKIDRVDPSRIAISPVILCKRFVQPDQKKPTVQVNTTYVPLVSSGIEFTPSAGTHFAQSDPLAFYFEIYEPASAEVQVRYRIRIVNLGTGETKVDTGSRDAARFRSADRQVLSISQMIALNKLGPGTYRVEVQGSDSAGQETPWRSAGFTVE